MTITQRLLKSPYLKSQSSLLPLLTVSKNKYYLQVLVQSCEILHKLSLIPVV